MGVGHLDLPADLAEEDASPWKNDLPTHRELHRTALALWCRAVHVANSELRAREHGVEGQHLRFLAHSRAPGLSPEAAPTL